MPAAVDLRRVMRADPDNPARRRRRRDRSDSALRHAADENDLHDKISKLEQELEAVLGWGGIAVVLMVVMVVVMVVMVGMVVMAGQHSSAGRDTRFMRDELNQLESQLEQREKDFSLLRREMSKEKKTSEELASRAEEAEEGGRKLRREDVDFYRRELEQKVAAGPGGAQGQETQRRLNSANRQLYECMEDLQNQQLQQSLEDSVREMENMTDEYNKMKIVVRELTEQLQRQAEEEDPVMAAVNTKVEEWKRVLSAKDEEILEYQQMVRELRERLRSVQAVQERDHQVKVLSEQVEQRVEELEERVAEAERQARLGPKEEVDLSDFLRAKGLRQRQYQAENQVLTKEIERLEEERLELKKQIRRMGWQSPPPSRWMRTTLAPTEYLQTELSDKERQLEQHKAQSTQFQAELAEVSSVKREMEATLTEVLQAMRTGQDPGCQDALSAPTLERLLTAMEGKGSTGKPGTGAASRTLQAQVDQMTGRNQELRQELRSAREEASDALRQLTEAQVTQLQAEADVPRPSSNDAATFALPLSLPANLEPSSAEIISTLNEYAMRLLQDNKNKEESVKQLTAALEKCKSKVGVIFHRQGLLYKEHISDKEAWQKEREAFAELKSKMEEQRDVDQVRIQEFNTLLETLQKDPEEARRRLAETVRQATVLRVNEKTLSRRYTLLTEREQLLRSENAKLRDDSGQMEAAVTERLGYLQRYKEMAAYRIAALQNALDESVPSSDLERANRQYTELTVKYRDMLQRDSHMVQRTSSLEHLEIYDLRSKAYHENGSLREQISELVKELEIAREKLNSLEQAWEQHCSSGGGPTAGGGGGGGGIAAHHHAGDEGAERAAAGRARAHHLTRLHLDAQRVERELRDQLADGVSKAASDADCARIAELEKAEAELPVIRSQVDVPRRLREVSDVAKMQVSVLEARQQSRDKETESLRSQVLDLQALLGQLHQQVLRLQLSEAAAQGRAEALAGRLRALEACHLRAEQRLDAGQRALYLAQRDGRGRARHLRQTVQALRRQFAGALPLSQQEKFSAAAACLQEERAQAQREQREAREQRRRAEARADELALKLAGLEELIATLQDAKGTQQRERSCLSTTPFRWPTSSLCTSSSLA
ncbi:hypothetical protein CRUP_005633 [Coryphaenoides rupestris]|nr:hypothetical protein CRUP_005633 [Coryphaenoides rupestris]